LILRPQSRRLATLCKSRGMAPFNDFTRRRQECHHVSIPRVRRLAIERKVDEKEWPLYPGTSPCRPRSARPTHANFKFKLSEHSFVDYMRARELRDSDVDV